MATTQDSRAASTLNAFNLLTLTTLYKAITVPALQMEKLWHREASEHAQGHTAEKQGSREWSPEAASHTGTSHPQSIPIHYTAVPRKAEDTHSQPPGLPIL